MILLQVQQVARHFGAEILFKNVNLDIQDNSKIALVGRNGAGKSTLIKMLIGQTKPDAGKISQRKDLTIGYLAQNSELTSNKTIFEEMLSVFAHLKKIEEQMHLLEQQMAQDIDHHSTKYQQLLTRYDQLQHDFKEQNGYGYENEIRSVLHGFHFYETDYQRSISSLSGGQKTRLALAKLLLEKRDLLILDEPTNHLDIETLTWLENYLQSYQGALLIVSHDRYFLDKVVNEVYELSQQTCHYYKGNYSYYIDEKAAHLKQQWKNYEKQQVQINKLEDFVNRNIVRASTTKRAQSRRKQLEKMERLERPEGEQKGPHFSFVPNKTSGDVVLQVTDGAIGYNDKILAAPINLDLRKQNVMAIVGPNGVGKSTLLKSILGQIPFIKGEAFIGTNVQIGYYDQEQKNLHPQKTVLNEIWDEHPTTPEKDIRSLLGSFLFSGDDVKKMVHSLSGGEKARLLLTKLAMQHDNFLLLDEPTNHLDIDSKEVLELALLEYPGTILFVSHDRYFINKIATSILEIQPTGSTLYLGDYDYYIAKKAEQELLKEQKLMQNAPLAEQSLVSQAKKDYQQSKEKQKQQRKLERLVAELEKQVEQLEAKKQEIEEQMADPLLFNDVPKLTTLQTELTKTNDQLSQVENIWEEHLLALEEFLNQ